MNGYLFVTPARLSSPKSDLLRKSTPARDELGRVEGSVDLRIGMQSALNMLNGYNTILKEVGPSKRITVSSVQRLAPLTLIANYSLEIPWLEMF